MSFGARAFIRLNALSHNLQVIRNAAPHAAVTAVVKANAYGHGLLVVAEALSDVDSFAVARITEAQSLRSAGIDKPIILLSGAHSAEELAEADSAACELVVHTQDQVALLESTSASNRICWLKIDTGMNRLGFAPDDAAEMIVRLQNCQAVSELRLMTHLANADDRADSKTDDQLRQFRDVVADFEGDISIGNSGGTLGWPAVTANDWVSDGQRLWVRPGIALYGISPFAEESGSELGLKPAMQFESRLVSIKKVSAGDVVGYGGHWKAQADTTLGIVSAGYGDGYPRSLPSGTPVLVNGRRVSLAGAVSMDMAAVDLGADAADKVGDPVVLWGDALPAEEIAKHAGTIPYTLVCGVMHREASEYS